MCSSSAPPAVGFFLGNRCLNHGVFACLSAHTNHVKVSQQPIGAPIRSNKRWLDQQRWTKEQIIVRERIHIKIAIDMTEVLVTIMLADKMWSSRKRYLNTGYSLCASLHNLET